MSFEKSWLDTARSSHDRFYQVANNNLSHLRFSGNKSSIYLEIVAGDMLMVCCPLAIKKLS